MYKETPLFIDPEGIDLKLYRYMDYAKLMSVLRKKSLFFCRTDKFDDPFEGTLPKKEFEYQSQYFGRKHLSEFLGNLRKLILVNCWHYNNFESHAMWKLFLMNPEGVAIETSFENLKTSFQLNQDKVVYAGKVRYLNYEDDIFYDRKEFPSRTVNTFDQYIHKRNYFRNEQEYRVIYDYSVKTAKETFEYDWANEEEKNGMFISVDLEALVKKIIVAPFTSNSFFDLVKETAKELFPSIDVVKSEIVSTPYG